MKFQFGFADRIALLNVTPKEGSFEDLIVAADLTKKIEINQKEVAKYEFKSHPTGNGIVQYTWNEAGSSYILEVELTELEVNLVKKTLEDLSNKKKLTVQLIDIYKQFCVVNSKKNN